jgi:hypothetical protein
VSIPYRPYSYCRRRRRRRRRRCYSVVLALFGVKAMASNLLTHCSMNRRENTRTGIKNPRARLVLCVWICLI